MDKNSKPSLYTDFLAAPSKPATMSTPFIGAVEDEWQMYSDDPADYTIGEPIGYGSSSIVHEAVYTPLLPAKPTSCALKVLDLDTLPPRSLHLLQRETTLMSLSKHPNVLRVRGSWMNGHKLYIALRLMNKGSAADVMRYGWPGGMEEEVCRCILRQALQGLNYLHINGFIHRDIKAANLLIDDDGTVLLGDLGVAADLSEDSSHNSTSSPHRSFPVTAKAALSPSAPQKRPTSPTLPNKRGSPYAMHPIAARPKMGKRKSFVGTPCWMAPELIQGKQYDSSADIWSFGITAIELTQGRAPRSRDPAKTVLLRTVQEDAPTIDREGGTFKYSRAFKEIVDRCLAKDPTKRPTAEELLQTPFFKGAKKKIYLVGAILNDLPPLTQRQERCLVHNTVVHPTIDSWDFSNTIHSPTSSLRRRAMFDLPAETEEDDTNSVFNPYDSDGEREADLAIQDSDISNGSEEQSMDAFIKRACLIPIQKPSSPSPYDATGSTPSSASDSPLPTPKSQALSPEDLDIEVPPLPPPYGSLPREGIISANDLPSKKPILAPVTPPLPRASLPPRPATASNAFLSAPYANQSLEQPSSTSSNQGIWHKIRTNVRRTRGSFGESTAPSSFAGRAMSMFGSGINKADSLRKSASRDSLKRDRGPGQVGVGQSSSKGKPHSHPSGRTPQTAVLAR